MMPDFGLDIAGINGYVVEKKQIYWHYRCR